MLKIGLAFDPGRVYVDDMNADGTIANGNGKTIYGPVLQSGMRQYSIVPCIAGPSYLEIKCILTTSI